MPDSFECVVRPELTLFCWHCQWKEFQIQELLLILTYFKGYDNKKKKKNPTKKQINERQQQKKLPFDKLHSRQLKQMVR